jgi:Flp pilus assembly protein TadD
MPSPPSRSAIVRYFEDAVVGAGVKANLAGTLLFAKRYDDAAAAFRLAVALSPADPDLRTNLGIALERAGHTAEAQRAYAEAERLKAASGRSPAKP